MTVSHSLCTVPLSSVVPYTHFDVQFLEKFGVTFRREGETVTLKCTLLVTPDLKRVQPRAEWYRDGEREAPPRRWPWSGLRPRPRLRERGLNRRADSASLSTGVSGVHGGSWNGPLGWGVPRRGREGGVERRQAAEEFD